MKLKRRLCLVLSMIMLFSSMTVLANSQSFYFSYGPGGAGLTAQNATKDSTGNASVRLISLQGTGTTWACIYRNAVTPRGELSTPVALNSSNVSVLQTSSYFESYSIGEVLTLYSEDSERQITSTIFTIGGSYTP